MKSSRTSKRPAAASASTSALLKKLGLRADNPGVFCGDWLGSGKPLQSVSPIDGRVLAANLMIWFGDTVSYLHGASSNVRREVMAPHLLHWKLINEAKSLSFKHYDFWGVAPEGTVNHPWAGVSRFKRGFGGRYVAYPGTFDLPLDRFWYRVYRLLQTIRGR